MLEQQIKVELINYLYSKDKNFDGVIVNEFVFDNFSRRADLLVINNGHLIVYEVKSESDDLGRLSGQVDNYLKYFDKVVLVVASKHLESAIRSTPICVEILEVNDNYKSNFKLVRRGRLSKGIESNYLLNLLKIKELKTLARELSCKVDDVNRSSLVERVSIESRKKIKNFVIDCLGLRFKYSSEAFKLICKDRKVTIDDLKLLSNNKSVDLLGGSNFKDDIKSEDKRMLDMQYLSNKPIFGEVPTYIKELLKNK